MFFSQFDMYMISNIYFIGRAIGGTAAQNVQLKARLKAVSVKMLKLS